MNIAGDHIRSVTKDKVNDTLPSSLVHRPSSFTTKDWSDALLLVNPCCFPLTLFFFNLFRNVSLSCKIDLKAHSFFFSFYCIDSTLTIVDQWRRPAGAKKRRTEVRHYLRFSYCSVLCIIVQIQNTCANSYHDLSSIKKKM